MKKTLLSVSSFLLIVIGIIVFSFNSYYYWVGTHLEEKQPATLQAEDFSSMSVEAETNEVKQEHLPIIGEKIGILSIPKLQQSLPIYEGTTKEVLKKGVGHVVSSVLPGEKNNSILSGHRDTVFRKLGELELNDSLIVATRNGNFLYKVKKIRIVDKNDRTVMVPKRKATLTLITCFPFRFIGPAPKRYVVEAEFVSRSVTVF